MKYISKYKSEKLFYTLVISGIWISLDTHFINFNIENFKDFTFFLRALMPFIIFIILVTNIKKGSVKIFIKNNNELSILFLLIFIFQIPGLVFSQNSILNISFIVNCISYLFFLFFFINDLNKLNLVLKISIIIFTIIFLVYGLGLLNWFIFDSTNLNLYGSWPHGLKNFSFSENVPRSSGVARNATIVYIVFSLLIINKKKNIFNISIITISFVLIFLTQSRIIFIFFTFYLLVYLLVIFSLSKKALYKISILNIAIIVPLIATISLVMIQNSKIPNAENYEFKKKEIYENIFRPINDKNVGIGSGRLNDWKNIISNNNKNIIGYGAMGDRYLINQSASNFFVYIYASSGFIGLIISIIFFIIIAICCFKYLLYGKFRPTRKNYKFLISYALIAFFLFRSLAETSFGIFGIDFLVFATALHYILIYNKKFYKNNLINFKD